MAITIFSRSSAPEITKLRYIGRKAAVYGVEERTVYWHIMRPGSFKASQNYWDYCVGKALCGARAVTNGYANDYKPTNDVCPACLEQADGQTSRPR